MEASVLPLSLEPSSPQKSCFPGQAGAASDNRVTDSGEIRKDRWTLEPRGPGMKQMSDRLRTTGPRGPGSLEFQEAVTTQVTDEDGSSARGSLAGEPGLLGLVGADVLERHVGGGRDPVSA